MPWALRYCGGRGLYLFALVEYYSSGRLSQHLLWVAALAGVVGLLSSRALVALSPVAGTVAALLSPHLRRDLPRYLRNGAALRAAAMLGFLLLTGFYTSEWAVWRHEVFRSLTWLGVPLAFGLAVPLAGWQRRAVGALFVLGTAAVGLATLVKYWLDPASGNMAISMGQNVQAVTGIFHIFFGVMLTLSAFWGAAMARQPANGLGLRVALGASAGVATIALHGLAYRTGLLVFYCGLLGCAGWLLLHRRQWALGLLLLLGLGLGPWLAYRELESVRKRVGTTVHDMQQYEKQNDINNFSLSRRLTAMEAALPIMREHWLLGVGPADTHATMHAQYDWHSYGLKRANRADLHSQYLETMLGGGVVGLTLWLAVVFWPLTQAWARRDAYLGIFILVQAATMLITDILSLQTGLNLFVFGYGFLVVAGERRQQLVASPENLAS